MIKKIIFSVILLISLALNGFFIYKFTQGETYVIPNDPRLSVKMSEENREFVMAEMRSFVESLQQINAGILYNDPKPIIEAGKRSGNGVKECAPEGLVETLPLAFKQLGFSTHDIFDQIAASAEKDFSPKKTQEQLNQLLNNCVACHKSFRIDVRK